MGFRRWGVVIRFVLLSFVDFWEKRRIELGEKEWGRGKQKGARGKR